MLKVWGELKVTPSSPSILLEFQPIPSSAPIFLFFFCFFFPFVFLSHNLSLLFTYSENLEVRQLGRVGRMGPS